MARLKRMKGRLGAYEGNEGLIRKLSRVTGEEGEESRVYEGEREGKKRVVRQGKDRVRS